MLTERLTLPSGGWVDFRDSEDLTGREYEMLKRHIIFGSETDTVLAMQATMAQCLIDNWSIPGKKNLKIPRDRGGINSFESLGWRDVKAIEGAIMPALIEMFFSPDDDPKDDGPESDDEKLSGE